MNNKSFLMIFCKKTLSYLSSTNKDLTVRINDLEEKNQSLNEENTCLKEEVKDLQEENKCFKEATQVHESDAGSYRIPSDPTIRRNPIGILDSESVTDPTVKS